MSTWTQNPGMTVTAILWPDIDSQTFPTIEQVRVVAPEAFVRGSDLYVPDIRDPFRNRQVFNNQYVYTREGDTSHAVMIEYKDIFEEEFTEQ